MKGVGPQTYVAAKYIESIFFFKAHFNGAQCQYLSVSMYNSYWSVVAERSSLPYSSSGVSSRMWVRIPAVTLVSLSKTLNHNCFSPPSG